LLILKPFNSAGESDSEWSDFGAVRVAAARGAGISVLLSFMTMAAQTGGTVALARLLEPRDFGLVAMSSIVAVLLMNFGLNGFTEAVVQCTTLNSTQASNLFWLNFSISGVLSLVFALSGGALARFYAEPRLVPIGRLLSVGILLSSLSVQHLALLKRATWFTTVYAIEAAARVISTVASIVLAWNGWSYWALVWGLLFQAAANAVLSFAFCRWIPHLPRRRQGTRALIRFAASAYARFCTNYAARNVDNVLIGWKFDAQCLGFYKKAYDLFAICSSLLITPLTSVGVSSLSKLRCDPAEYGRCAAKAIALLSFVGFGAGALLTLTGPDAVYLLLGPRWSETGRIFIVFGPGIGPMLICAAHTWLHLSLGRADRWFRWSLVEFGVTAALFASALWMGPMGIGAAWTVSYWILAIPALYYAGKPIGFGLRQVFPDLWKQATAAAAAGIATWAILHNMLVLAGVGVPSAISRMAASSALFAAAYVASTVLLHWGFGPTATCYSLLKLLLGNRPAACGPLPVVVRSDAAGGS
jgi:O-antigen/teichoic acid export membrane protein